MDERYFNYNSNKMIANAKLLEQFLQYVGEDFRKASENVLEVETAEVEAKCNIVPELAKLSGRGYSDAFRGTYLVRWSVLSDELQLEVRVFDINKFIETFPNRGIITAIETACSLHSCKKQWEAVTDIEELGTAIISQVDKFVNDVTKVIELAEKEVKKMTENLVIKLESKND